jgi:transcriptional regulator with XRE-family HTH domain
VRGMEILAARLKWLREKERYSQSEVAKKINMSQSGYHKVEAGERDPKLDVLVNLAKLFKVTTDFLLGLTDDNGDFSDTSLELQTLAEQLDMLNDRHALLTSRVFEVEAEIKILSDDYYINSAEKERLFHLKGLQNEMNNEKIQLEYKRHDVIKKYFEVSNGYIIYLLEIPNANPENDKVLDRLSPIIIEVGHGVETTYAVDITTKHGFKIKFDKFETEEDAKIERDRIAKLLRAK